MAKIRRSRKMKYRRRRGFVNDKRPFLIVIAAMAAVAILIALIVKVIVPAIRSGLGIGIASTPTPSPSSQLTDDFTDRIHEVLFGYRYKYISSPVLVGDRIYFASGSDNAGNPKLSRIYYHTMDTANSTINPPYIEAIEAKNKNILSIAVGEEHLVYFDAGTSGGGEIYAYEFASEELTLIKNVYFGVPKLNLAGKYAVWLERTGNKQDKLYMADVTTGELTTLEVFEDSIFGLSQPSVSDSEVVWASVDPQHADSMNYGIMKILKLTGEDAGTVSTYSPGMYVHDPVTNGTARAWSDTDDSGDATLYFSYDGTMPRMIAQNVTDYMMGGDFIVYSSAGQIWAYYWETARLVRISKASELSVLMYVSNNAAAWLDITSETKIRDILKYSVLD